MLSNVNQLMVVSAQNNKADVFMFIKDVDWKIVLSSSGFIGKNGLGKTKEGDMKTPIGKYRITDAFGIKDNPGTMLPYTKVDSSYYWIDDSKSKYYNRLVSMNDVRKDWNSAENILGEGRAYSYVLALDYNSECLPGIGSAIFIHVSIGRATSGCIAIPENDMILIMRNVKSDCAVIIDSPENLGSYFS